MEFKPNKSLLIAYLYGETSEEESEKMRAYLETDPETKDELKQLAKLRNTLHSLEDEYMPTPIILPQRQRFSKMLVYKYAAATVPLLIATIVWLAISGQSGSQYAQTSGISSSVDSISIVYKDILRKQDEEYRKQLETYKAELTTMEEKLNKVSKISSQPIAYQGISHDQIETMISNSNLKQWQDISLMLLNERRQYEMHTEQLISQLNAYYDTRRDQDLENIQLVLNSMQESQLIQKNKTDYLLAELVPASIKSNTSSKSTNK